MFKFFFWFGGGYIVFCNINDYGFIFIDFFSFRVYNENNERVKKEFWGKKYKKWKEYGEVK